MAADYCNCFNDLEKNTSSKTKELIAKAAESANLELTLTTDLQVLPDDEKMTVAQEMMAMGKVQDNTSTLGMCMAAADKKYKNEPNL